MKKWLLCSLLLLCAAFAFCETVMVYVFCNGEVSGVDEQRNRLTLELEGGVMDEFFENGHIVFDMGKEKNGDSKFSIDQDTFPLYLAESGGASFLLRVSVRFSEEFLDEDDVRWLPKSAEYDFWQVNDAQVLKKGTISAVEIENEHDPPEKTSFNLGKAVAQEALGVLKW